MVLLLTCPSSAPAEIISYSLEASSSLFKPLCLLEAEWVELLFAVGYAFQPNVCDVFCILVKSSMILLI